MTQTSTNLNLAGACSQMDGSLQVPGPHAPLSVLRDAFGVPHVRAQSEHDAWFGQGFAGAQDRLWQMEYDRRRATGRWAEAAGAAAVGGDRLSRRLQLSRAAQADLGAMSDATRAMFEAYAAGVNAFLDSGQPLPIEYALAGIAPEPWQSWHSVAAFKIRHVLMGVWQRKLALAKLLATVGPEVFGRLSDRPPAGSAVILPPSGAVADLYEHAGAEIEAVSAQLGFLAEVEAGSNSGRCTGRARPPACRCCATTRIAHSTFRTCTGRSTSAVRNST